MHLTTWIGRSRDARKCQTLRKPFVSEARLDGRVLSDHPNSSSGCYRARTPMVQSPGLAIGRIAISYLPWIRRIDASNSYQLILHARYCNLTNRRPDVMGLISWEMSANLEANQ